MAFGAGRANAASVWLISSDTTLQADYNGQIVIVGQGVTLNCAGHTVSGDGTGAGISVQAGGVTVTQCQVHGFGTAIVLVGHDGAQALGNVATHNGEGIRLAGATGATVSGNSANNNDNWGIIVAEGSNGNTISGNAANNNGIIGFALNTTANNVFSNNTANHNGGNGFDLLSASDNQLANNTANANGNAGFDLLTASSQNSLTGNVANNNGAPGNGFGFEFGDASNNTVAGNAAFHNSGVGFFPFFGSQFNLFTQNKGCQNFYVDAADISTGAGNTWSDNDFCATGF